MKLRTEIDRVPLEQPIDCSDGILFLGSCFSDHIGGWMEQSCLNVCSNPFGTLYNPASIARNMTLVGNRFSYDPHACLETDVIRCETGSRMYVSFDHHGRFVAETPDELCRVINETQFSVLNFLQSATHWFVTWGSAYIYELKGTGRVVANCHKFPSRVFDRRRLSIDEIVESWSQLISQYPYTHFVFTVSPIRHVRDGLHDNQISKSILILAAEELRTRFPKQVEYLPIYEFFMDDLRDYRFYSDDLVHPSSMAVDMVKEYVGSVCFTARCRKYMAEVDSLLKALEHRPLRPDSKEYQVFLKQQIEKATRLSAEYGVVGLDRLKLEFAAKLKGKGQ